MSLSDYGTYLGIATVLAALLAGFDLILPAQIKRRLGATVRRLLETCGYPFGVTGYLFVLSSSITLTLIVGLLTGVWSKITEEGEFLSLPLKSAGPLIVAIIGKILIWDYFLALKSYVVVRASRAEHERAAQSGKNVGSLGTALFIIGCCDIVFSTALTNSFIGAFELSSLEKALGPENMQKHIPVVARSFFDELSFSLKFSIERAFYILNGTFVFYFGAAISKLAKKQGGIVDWSSAEDKPFTIFSLVLLAIILVVLSSIALAYR